MRLVLIVILLILIMFDVVSAKSLRVLKGKGVCNSITCNRQCQQESVANCGICRNNQCACVACG